MRQSSFKYLAIYIQFYISYKLLLYVISISLSRRGMTPKYDLVQIEGAVHEPTFKYRKVNNNKI